MAHRSAAELEAERLMIEAAQRDRAAFAPLYERYVDQIYAYAHTLTRNRELAEDVTASTFAKAIEDLPRFEWRGVPYSAWLYRVAANLVARQARRPPWVDLDAHQPVEGVSPEVISQQRDRDATVRAAVATLPPDQRQAVLLRFGGGLRNREIGEIMGRSEGAVKLLTFRAMTALRRELGRRCLPSVQRRDPVNTADMLYRVLDGSDAGQVPSSLRGLVEIAADVAQALAAARLSRADKDRIYARSQGMLEAKGGRRRGLPRLLCLRRPAPVLVGGAAALTLGAAALGWAILHGRRAGHPAAA